MHSRRAVYRVIIFSVYCFFWDGEIFGVRRVSYSDTSLLGLDFFSLTLFSLYSIMRRFAGAKERCLRSAKSWFRVEFRAATGKLIFLF
jgi:hypothetical protein